MLDRTIKPQPSRKINFDLPEINIFTLENSLKVFHINKVTLPIIQIKLIIQAGNIYCDDNKIGTSTLTSMLIDEGAGNLSGLEISDKIESLGSILNISSNKEFVTLSLLTLKENLEQSLKIFSLIVKEPRFSVSDFNREFQRLQTQIIQLNDDPGFVANKKFNKIIYNSTRYQYPAQGSVESISNLTNEDVKSFYKGNYVLNRSSIIVVGDIDKNELADSLNGQFNSWQNSFQRSNEKMTVRPSKRQIVLVHKSDAAQSEIRMGHFSKQRNSDDFYARSILNSILGGQFSSRINLNLREDKGFTYGAHSNYIYNQLGSSFVVSTSVKTENTVDSIKELQKELENARTKLTEDEIKFSKSYLIRRYPSLFETYSQIATNISLLPIYNLDKNYFSNYIKNIAKTSLKEVSDAALENIRLNELITVVVGNKNKIEKELSKLAELNDIEFISES